MVMRVRDVHDHEVKVYLCVEVRHEMSIIVLNFGMKGSYAVVWCVVQIVYVCSVV